MNGRQARPLQTGRGLALLLIGWGLTYGVYHFNGGPQAESLRAFLNACSTTVLAVLIVTNGLAVYGLGVLLDGLARRLKGH